MITEVTGNTFKTEVLDAASPVLVDFWAPWCGPCRMFSPIIEEFAQEQGANVKVAKVNIDNAPDLAQQYGVMGVPTVVLFKNGQPVQRAVGVQPKEALRAMVQ